MSGGETAQTLDRGVQVLYLLADAPDGLTVAELARRLGVARSIVYRLVTTLERRALARRGLDARYRLGLGVLALARHIQPILRGAARPALRALSDQADATAFLAVADAGEMLTVAVAEPPASTVHVACAVGGRSPIGGSAAGHAVLRQRQNPGRGGDSTSLVADVVPGWPVSAVAAAVPGVPGLEASVGVLLLTRDQIAEVEGHVAAAARGLAAGLA